jgi:hypothetical protein
MSRRRTVGLVLAGAVHLTLTLWIATRPPTKESILKLSRIANRFSKPEWQMECS